MTLPTERARRVLLHPDDGRRVPLEPDEIFLLEAHGDETELRTRGRRRLRDVRALKGWVSVLESLRSPFLPSFLPSRSPDPSSCKGEGLGLGASLSYVFDPTRPLELQFEWIHDLHTEKRLGGDWFTFAIIARIPPLQSKK